MSARILVVDDSPLNVKLLEAKLARDYYIVSAAEDGYHALEAAVKEQPDLILLDVMMPELDGFEVCKRLKADPMTCHIPVVMVTALSDVADRVHGLEVGADDFLTKPINDLALMARVRSLLRLKMMMDEWRLREATAAHFDLGVQNEEVEEDIIEGGHVLLLEDDPGDQQMILRTLEMEPANLKIKTVNTVAEALEEARTGIHDIVMTSLDLLQEDGLSLCAQLRAHETTRTLPVLLLANAGEIDLVAKGLDLGANDYLLRPLEGSELIARTRTQLRQKRHYDRLHKNYEQSLALALVDPLTGAYNRRYLDTHLPKMFARNNALNRPLSVLYFDIDFFKKVNDTYGHPAGDIVLKEVVARVIKNLRPMDLVVRVGGEEFVVILPETEQKIALAVADRLCDAISSQPFHIPNIGIPLTVTISVGAASSGFTPKDGPSIILQRADEALLRAKQTGRNKIVGEAEIHA